MDINLDFLKPVFELVQNEEVQKKLGETARLYWSVNGVTVNLIPSTIALILGTLAFLAYLGVPIFSLLGGQMFNSLCGGGYGASSSGYGVPSADYGAPSPGYGVPSHGQGRSDYEQQLASLQGSTYYTGPVGDGAQTDINEVGFSS